MIIVPHIPIEIGDPAEVTLLLVGCGGTGSFAALHLARLAYEARRSNRPKLRLIFCDPDRVEEKNIGRQNFCPAEIGQAKAMALASRYNLAFGLQIGAIVGVFASNWLLNNWYNGSRNGLLVVVGCVDNPAARESIARFFSGDAIARNRNAWWLDAGNSEHAGQVLIGNSLMAEPVIDPLLGRCVMLPLPAVQEPGLIVNSQLSMVNDEALSCAELTALNAQSLMINQVMAGWIGVYVYRLLAHDLDIYQTWLDLRGGNVRSVAITEGQAAAVPDAWAEVGEMLDAFGEAVGGFPGVCPECGGELTEGRDVLADEVGEEDIVFCPACGWQMATDVWEGFEDGDDNPGDDRRRPGAGHGVAVAVEVAE
jgi:PRTRC genetic system ThiF family protein